jgi:hypothetical protein
LARSVRLESPTYKNPSGLYLASTAIVRRLAAQVKEG